MFEQKRTTTLQQIELGGVLARPRLICIRGPDRQQVNLSNLPCMITSHQSAC